MDLGPWLRWAALGAALAAATTLTSRAGLLGDPISLHAVLLGAIAAVYVGFALADGRLGIVTAEAMVALAFLGTALAGLGLDPVWIGIGLAGHGVWDVLHHPRGIRTRIPSWYPPLCAVYDWILAALFLAGAALR